MISLVVLNYNGKRLIKTCLDSIARLNYKDKEVIFIDNASSDDSVEFVLKHYSSRNNGKPPVRVIANKKNSGYAGGANQAVRVSSGEFVMILNPDIVFEPDYLEALVRRLKADSGIGAIIGKLRKYDFEHGKKTNLIDSAGLEMLRNRRCVDRGQGEEDCGQYDRATEVFGVTGACPLYRRTALEDCKIGGVNGEYFDSDFFMYKEDVDISWRMRLFGWKCFYEPKAVANHGRGTGVLSRAGVLEVAAGRSKLSKFSKFYSYKNERLMRVKNEFLTLVARDFLSILWKEILMTGWILLREQFLIKSFFKFLWQLPGALMKRREIMARVKVNAREMGKWFY